MRESPEVRSGGQGMTVLILLSMVFSVFHLPDSFADWISYWRPQWLLLALVLWVQLVPHFRGALFRNLFAKRATDEGTTTRRVLLAVWLLGFYVDALLGDPFGVNGAIFASIAFYLLRFKDRLHLQTLSQQMIMIFMMVFVSEIFRSYVHNTVLNQVWDLQPLTLAVSSMLLWPLYDWIGQRFRGTALRN